MKPQEWFSHLASTAQDLKDSRRWRVTLRRNGRVLPAGDLIAVDFGFDGSGWIRFDLPRPVQVSLPGPTAEIGGEVVVGARVLFGTRVVGLRLVGVLEVEHWPDRYRFETTLMQLSVQDWFRWLQRR